MPMKFTRIKNLSLAQFNFLPRLPIGALRKATISVNLRKDSFVVAQFIAPRTFKEKRRNELRDYER